MNGHHRQIIAGIDLAAGHGTTAVALLELADESARPRYLFQAHRAIVSDEEIVSGLVDACPTVIAIDAPLSLPAPVAAAVRGNASSVGAMDVLQTSSGGRPLAAVPNADAALGAFEERPPAPQTTSPYTRAAERDPLWSSLSLRPLPVSFLGGLTFRALVLVPKLRSALPNAAIVEVFPTATLRLLGIRPVVPGPKREAKTSEAARRATQEGLARYVDGVPASGEELLSADLLDALAAALTGVAYSRREFVAVGDVDEGQILLPNREFASSLANSGGNAR